MTADYSTAKSEIFSQFYDNWITDSPLIVGYEPKSFFGGIEYDKDLDTSLFYAKIRLHTESDKQKTLSTTVTEIGKRRYESKGSVLIEILCPLSNASYTNLGELLAQSVQNSFRGKETLSCVLFQNVRITEGYHDDKFYSFEVIVNFNYETIA